MLVGLKKKLSTRSLCITLIRYVVLLLFTFTLLIRKGGNHRADIK